MTKRIYIVRDATTGDERLVSAASQAAALSHVAKTTFYVSVASVADAIRLTTEGVATEEAGKARATQAEAGPVECAEAGDGE